MLKVGLIQTTSSDQPADNLQTVSQMICDAHAQGAQFIVTPEVTNCVSTDRKHQAHVLSLQEDDISLRVFCELAQELGVWLMIGSLALKSGDPDGRFVNRCFLIAPDGSIAAEYDKIHMFDVALSETETYQESKGYRPGDVASIARCDFGTVGLSICYDLRFPHLFRDLAQAGAQIITVPSAFATISGEAHWHVLLRARAIETGCFIIAPAQTGQHVTTVGKQRKTYGHSLVVSPWGDVLLDAETTTGVSIIEIDLETVETARRRIPSLQHDRKYQAPKCQTPPQKTP
ncbi:carbon-nitrogen hydrolase family protein [Amylibacter sp. SFDW26]|uniref:carbon-nitrogen hydrolase family protein n=1 Tax=Amylibacter sp. SFDW26 TaxID=2652722 RepID=UPI001261728D|nr:carbon-nitrogen hydrolase family protein [Amylibacter sp. SFDW26]KAB7614605.1 carbon-nitrogen hydrolase family protein [Amylibacter sp. SFDW26]